MKTKILIACLSVLLLAGCANVEYGDFKYTRWGKQSIDGFKANIKKDGSISIRLDGQEGSAGNIAETAKNLSEIAKKLGGM